jgi:catechol 2,3-dioxygenase-like lactoylglutathione lyase family enzyme
MFDHISIGVKELKRTQHFYDAAFKPLGFKILHKTADTLGYGVADPKFWVTIVERPVKPDMKSGLHFCFSAGSREAVDGFHEAGLAAGGQDNGAPGLRPDYGPRYYASFVIDPDGYRLEAYFVLPD